MRWPICVNPIQRTTVRRQYQPARLEPARDYRGGIKRVSQELINHRGLIRADRQSKRAQIHVAPAKTQSPKTNCPLKRAVSRAQSWRLSAISVANPKREIWD